MVVGFVSPLHKDRIPRPSGLNHIISSADDIGRVAVVGNPILVAVVLSGGTSALIRDFVNHWGLNRVLLVSYPGNNSLASLLDAKSAILDLGVRNVGVIHVDGLERLGTAIRLARASARLLRSRVAVIGLSTKTSIIRNFEERFEARVDLIPMEEFEELINGVTDDEAGRFANELMGRALFNVPTNDLLKVGRVYVAMRGLHGPYDAIAINCFPFLIRNRITPCLALAKLNEEGLISACEGDLRALTVMLISRELTGYSGWIANVNDVVGKSITMSHCTIALNMVEEPRVVTHFESGYNYGLTGKIKFREVTAASVSSDFRRMVAFKALVSSSGLLRGDACRTQGVLQVDFEGYELLNEAPYNHHVVIPGNVIQDLRAVASLLGMEFKALAKAEVTT